MESQESQAPAPGQPQHHPPPPPQQQQQQPQPQQPTTMLMAPQPQNNSYPTMQHHHQHPHQHQQPQPQQQQARFPFNSMVTTGPKPLDYTDGPSGFSIEPAKKKRGRPRKYSPDGNIALALSPTPITPTSAATPISSGAVGHHQHHHSSDFPSAGAGDGTPNSDNPGKRARGRPPGSGKKQLDALGAPGVGFTPHVITVKAGEDIASKIMAFSQQGPRTVCILSANGAICNVTLRQPATSGGTVTYEGRFEIISLSGSFLLSENNGNRSRTGGLSVSLAGSDGRVLGGGVAGMLMAASPVQVVVGSFIADGGKKSKSGLSSAPPALPPPAGMLNFGAPGSSPPSQNTSSESSDENGGSPINRAGPYTNAGQPIQTMPMYANMGWANSSIKMHPN